MLRMFCNVFSSVFQVLLQVFHKHVLSVSSIFRRMLQMLHLDVSEVDRVLYMGTRMGSGRGHKRPRTQSGNAGDVRAAWEMSGGTLVEICWCERVRRTGDGV